MLGLKQPAMVQLERRMDVCLSALRDFIEAAGGNLELMVEISGIESVRLGSFEDLHSADEDEAALPLALNAKATRMNRVDFA